MTPFSNNLLLKQGLFSFKTGDFIFIPQQELTSDDENDCQLKYTRFKNEEFDLNFCLLLPKGTEEKSFGKATMSFSVRTEKNIRANDENFSLLIQHAYNEFIHKVNSHLHTSFPKLRLYDSPDVSVEEGRTLRTVDADVL